MPAYCVSRDFLRSVQRGNLDKLRELKDGYGIEDWTVYRHDSTGDTALHIAAREGHLEIAKYLCNDWPYPAFKFDVTNKDMKRPLHYASQFSHSDIVEFLINQGAEVDALKRGDWTPLMLACAKDNRDAEIIVNTLLRAGANPIIRNKDGWTPLLLACRCGNVDIIKTLLNNSAVSAIDKSYNGRTGLHIAAFHGHFDAMKVLINSESSLMNTRDSTGSTPLHESVKSLNFQVFEWLMKFGADVGEVDGNRQTILHTAASIGNYKVVQYIVNNSLIDCQCKDNYGATPLSCAQRNKMDNIVKFFEQLGKT